MPYAPIVEPGTRCKLADCDPGETQRLEKNEARSRTEELAAEIEELQELMYAIKDTALLLVLQGMDTSGKDGAINRILSYINVQSCRTVAFKVPTADELSHDFLWRIHRHAPEVGGVTIFNRSHYEDVVVVRVHRLVPKEVWCERYERINEFEELLAESRTIVLKFFLHISEKEQEERLLAREQDPAKAWKLSANDWKERRLWEQYQEAYQDAVSKCSPRGAPWRIVPANHKWYRDLAVAEAIRDVLKPRKEGWLNQLEEMGKRARAEIEAFRKLQP
jgi:PPK2 family polyphosphate:nucleotide phosphotransferase